MCRERHAPVRLTMRQQVEQKGVKTVHNILAQAFHFLVTDASQPIPGDLAIGADDLHIGVVARLGTRDYARVEILHIAPFGRTFSTHLPGFKGRLVTRWRYRYRV